MGILKTILIILIVYYVLKIVARMAFPMMMKSFVGKMEKKFQGQQQNQYREPKAKVGETTIDKAPSEATSNKEVGEYVDYEEID